MPEVVVHWNPRHLRLYRFPQLVLVFVGSLSFIGGLAAGDPILILGSLVYYAFCAWMFLIRVSKAYVSVGAERVTIRNIWNTSKIDIEEVEHFEAPAPGTRPGQAQLLMVNGNSRRVDVLVAGEKPEDREWLDARVGELNSALRRPVIIPEPTPETTQSAE